MVAPKASHASLIGMTVGNYKVQALIGRGAMGAVYLATDKILGRSVALKVLLGSLAHNPEHVRRFQMEAKAASPLVHPNVVRIYEAGNKDGIPFIAMEYVEGEPLDRFLKREGPRLQWQLALSIAQQVAEALDCAHNAGIVHRDVKPANILLDRQGRVRLTDFGIANVHQNDRHDQGSDISFGTPEYMSPEQCGNAKRVSPESDLFSLGVTLYRMLTGAMPFEGDSMVALVQSIVMSEPRRVNRIVPEIPDDVARLVAHLMEKDPRYRPASAKEVSKTIERLRQERGGASALPEALTAFIREQAKPREIQYGTPVPQSRKRLPGIPTPRPRFHYTPISLKAKLLMVAFAFLTMIGVAYLSYLRAEEPIPKPMPLDVCSFTTIRPGMIQVDLPDRAWQVDKIHWVGEQSLLAVSLSGAEGTTAKGAYGIILLDPINETVDSLVNPAGPFLSTASPYLPIAQTTLSPIQPGFKKTDTTNVILRTVVPAWREYYGNTLLVLAQSTESAFPTPQPLVQLTRHQWDSSPPGETAYPCPGDVVLHPNGQQLCLLLWAPGEKHNYLVERDIRWKPLDRLGQPKTTPGFPILPGTIQYSPNGKYLAYMREKSRNRLSLWAIESSSTQLDGTLLTLGNLSKSFSFSPVGDALLFSQKEDGREKISMADLRTGKTRDLAVYGAISSEAWHPTGQYALVAYSSSATQPKQLWTIEMTPPYKSHALPRIPEGVIRGAALSRDGRWAASVSQTHQGEKIVLLDMTVAYTAI